MDEKLLKIYLNDHLAGSVGGIELAKRCQSNNEGSPLGDFLADFLSKVRDSQNDLEQLMDSLGAPKDPVKQAAVWVAEKLGRLKLNGQLTGYSDLSRVLELEGLCLGVEGQLELWRALRHVSKTDDRLAILDYDSMIDRAEGLREGLEQHRLEAAARAFA